MLTLMFCWLTFAHAAQKRALYFGGGGEPPGAHTIFDDSVESVARILAAGRYETSVAFDGGHGNLDRALGENFADVTPFTPADAHSRIRDLERDIERGQISQALILISSHGEPPRPGAVHLVATKEKENFDVGDLERLQAVAKRKGVKLAVIDASCYSGQSLQLAERSPETCVITAGSRETTAYLNFQTALFDELKAGESIEAAFLRARRATPGATWAQISSPAGLVARDAMAKLHDDATPFEPDIRASDADRAGLRLCFGSVARQFENLRRLFAAVPKADRAGATELARLYREYRDLRTAKAAELNADAELFTLPSGTRVSRQTLVTLDDQAPREQVREVKQFREDLMRRVPEFGAAVAAYNKSRPKRTGYESPEYIDDRYPYREVQAAANRIDGAERKVYDAIYRAHAKSKGANACRDFKF